MHIAQIAEVKLKGSAADKIPHSAYIETVAWLKQWTPQANFKAVIASDLDSAISVLRADLQKTLLPSFLRCRGVLPEHFTFQVCHQAAEDGRFWAPIRLRLMRDFDIVAMED